MSDGAMQSTLRELQRLLSAPRLWAALAGASLLLGLVGPFGTFDRLELLPRFAYWTAIVVLTYVAGLATVYLVMAFAFRPRSTSLPAYALAGAIAGLPVAGIVLLLNVLLYGAGSLVGALALTLYCVAIAAIVSLLVALFSVPRGETDASAPRPAPAGGAEAVNAPARESVRRPAILDRLPVQSRGRLAYLSMQDHYVDVRTDKGGTLVLMRLADAIGETNGVPGLQIHRSHWVAVDAVAAAVRRDGRLLLRMADGAELPVSRPYLAAVREAGLAG